MAPERGRVTVVLEVTGSGEASGSWNQAWAAALMGHGLMTRPRGRGRAARQERVRGRCGNGAPWTSGSEAPAGAQGWGLPARRPQHPFSAPGSSPSSPDRERAGGSPQGGADAGEAVGGGKPVLFAGGVAGGILPHRFGGHVGFLWSVLIGSCSG